MRRLPASLALAAGLLALLPHPTAAHIFGGDADDPVQQYGVFLFLGAVVLIGAGVLVYVMLAPTSSEEDHHDHHEAGDKGTRDAHDEERHERGDDRAHDGHDHAPAPRRSAFLALNREYALVVLSGLLTAVGFFAHLVNWPPSAATACFAAAIAAGAALIVPRGLAGVFSHRTLDINFLITLAVAGAIALGEWGEGATVAFLFALGEALESATLARTRRAIQGLMAMAPATAQLKLDDGSERTTPVERVPVGATVAVRPGERVPLDGTVVAGHSAVDQAPITGESVPADKTTGDPVYGGTINTTGYLEIRTTRPFAENTLARIIHLVESAQSEKAPSQRFVERFARVYTPAVVALAVLVAFVPPILFSEPIAPWFNRALVLLLIACPCALVLATPVAVAAAIGNASRNGVLVKGGAYLERTAALRAVAFDKTGTLTRGVPEVRTILPLDGTAERDLLALAAAAELRSEHPLAAAIVRAARRAGIADLPAVREFRALPGRGVTATVDGASLLVGTPAWLAESGASTAHLRETLDSLAATGQTPVLLARATGGARPEPIALIGIADELRPTAAGAVATLRRTGIDRIVLLSGDAQPTAEAIARHAGIPPEDVRGGLLPEDKVAAIRDLVRHHGQTAMVGDGINDAPALAAATVGIAVGAGASDAALESADIALVADDLTRVPWVLNLARRAARTIRVNVALALATKAAVAILAALGLANLWLAIATDVGATVLVILNGMRLLGGVSTDAHPDEDAARARYGLGKADPHAGHAH